MQIPTEKQLEYIARKYCSFYCSEDDLWRGRRYIPREQYVEENWKDYVEEMKQIFEWYFESKKEILF